MQITHEKPENGHTITACAPGKITINGNPFQQSVLLTPDTLNADWPPQSIKELTAEHLAPLITEKPEVILLGTGDTHAQVDPALLADCYAARIGVEVMSTAAACRTYNVLATDGRRVAAGLLIR